MTTTEQYTIHNVIQMIESGEIKIPIFQRRYVWSKEQVEKLFTTVFNDNPFGAISAIKTTDDYPIYASRTFFEDLKDKFQLSEYNDGQNHNKDNPLYLILDGQQRLQSFYLGLTAKFDEMELCFNKKEGLFIFLAEYDKSQYISVKQLYKKLVSNHFSYESIAKSFNAENIEIINKNIFKFYYHFFFQKRILLLLAYPQGKTYEKKDKNKLFELFQRLNTGGVNLDKYDLYASKLKAYNHLWEKLFIKIDQEFGNIVYYPYSLPFCNNTTRHGKYLHNLYKNLEGYKSFIPVLYYCFNNKYLSMYNFQDIGDDCIETMSERIKDYNDVNILFNFICIIFDLCRIINIPEFELGLLINQLYVAYIENQYKVNVQDFIIDYFILRLSKRFKSKFANQNSLQLFIFKYFLNDDLNHEYKEPPILYCKKDDEAQLYEIQINKNVGDLKIPIVGIRSTKKYLFKFADTIVEDALKNATNDFKQKWKVHAQKSSEWKTLNDNYKITNKI